MSSKSSVEIDFTGKELVAIGEACIKAQCTLSEFIERAMWDAVNEYRGDSNGLQ
jgi:hypothetical protein